MDDVWEPAVFVFAELRGAEEEGEVLVVVETPDTMGACRLEEVGELDFAHEDEVFLEDAVDDTLEVFGAKNL